MRMKRHQKTIILVQKRRIIFLQNELEAERARVGSLAVREVPTDLKKAVLPIIYKSELDYISRCILDCPNIETGGQMFGYWTASGVPVVLFAIGPGVKANHRSTFFNQDVQYLMAVGTELKNRFGLMHIGEWHSHHQLGLARPSGHDVQTMVSTIREKDLGRFLLCIGNCNSHSSTLNPFMCDDRTCTATKWDVIHEESPMRKPVYAHMSDILHDPITQTASHMDPSLMANTSAPVYAERSWMRNRESGALLNGMMNYVKGLNSLSAEVKVKLDDAGQVHICVSNKILRREEDILFPDAFPVAAPQFRVTDSFGSKAILAGWDARKGPFEAFKSFYQTVKNQL